MSQGIAIDPVSTKKSFFSLDCVKWAQVASVHPVVVSSAGKIRGRFTGNPSHEYSVSEVHTDKSHDVPEEVKSIRSEVVREDGSKQVTTLITEDKRLAAMIATLDHDTAIVPRGALRLTPTNAIEQSRTFEGLNFIEAQNLQSYFHLRVAESLPQKTLLERAKLDKALDFLDTIADDTPYGVWNVQTSRGGAVVHLRSLLWPGFVFYHAVGTRKFGYLYWGSAEKNLDLPFMLA